MEVIEKLDAWEIANLTRSTENCPRCGVLFWDHGWIEVNQSGEVVNCAKLTTNIFKKKPGKHRAEK